MRWIGVVLMCVVFLLPARTWPHENHNGEIRLPDTALTVSSEDVSTPSLFEALQKGMFDHLHNKLVHFPIALGMVAVLFVFLALRYPSLETSGEILVWLAAASALFAVATGLAQEETLEETFKHDWVEIHEVLGLITAGSLFAWGFLFRFRPFRRFTRLWGVVVFLLLAFTGAVGGVIAHG